MDYIYAKELDQLKTAVQKIVGNQCFESLAKIYTEEKLTELRKVIIPPNNELLKVHDVDTLADTTMLSGLSEILPSVDGIPKDDKLSQKFKELQEKTISAQKRVEKLRKQNKDLKTKLKRNNKHNSTCIEKQKIEAEPMATIISGLTSEIDCYTTWIDGYRRTSKPFFENIYDMIVSHLKAFYGKNITVQKSGSYENGLIMPWSDLNLLVTFHHDARSENRHRNFVIDSTKKFSKVLKTERNTVKSCLIEERNTLLILKLQLTKQFREQNVEIIFKYYTNPAYPSNEEIMHEYLDCYPQARPLYIVFRTILHKARLDDPSLHGLKSVVIFLMIVAYLQNMEISSAKPIGEIPTGELLLNFLFFYSYGFDYYRDYIRCYPVCDTPVMPFGPKDPIKKINSLMIVNPYNDDIILTKSFKRTAELKQLIKLCYISIFSRCSCLSTKTLTIKPKLSLNSKKASKSDKSFEIFDEGLDDYRAINAKYVHLPAKKGAKRSLHIAPENIKEINRASFGYSLAAMDEIFQAELELYRPVTAQGMPGYMIQGLFNFNFNPDVNI